MMWDYECCRCFELMIVLRCLFVFMFNALLFVVIFVIICDIPTADGILPEPVPKALAYLLSTTFVMSTKARAWIVGLFRMLFTYVVINEFLDCIIKIADYHLYIRV